MTQPVSLDAIVKFQDERIPDFVIDAVNGLLKEQTVNGFCRLTQDEIMEAVLKHPDFPEDQFPRDPEWDERYDHRRGGVFERKWLDFEKRFRDAGWRCDYYKGPYYDTTPAYFVFQAPKSK